MKRIKIINFKEGDFNLRFTGIDVHLRSVVISTIDEKLNVIEVEEVSFVEAVNRVELYSPAIVAIDAPANLNTGLMNDEKYRTSIGSKIKGHYNKKVSEYELSRRGINPFSTPDSIGKIRIRNHLSWMEKGFWIYETLMGKGYILLNEKNYLDNKDNGVIEVFPHASFSTLAGEILPNKNSDEGINQRYILLEKAEFNNLESILSRLKRRDKDDYLDSLVAAYTGYLIYTGKGSFVGDIDEGQIALPVSNIKDSYKRSKDKQIPYFEEYINSDFYEYEFLHNDSALWLKHFVPINNSPNIKDVLGSDNQHMIIRMRILNDEGKTVDALFTKMQGQAKGLKVMPQYKNILKDFWGSNGDDIKYKIKIVNK